MKTDFLGNGWSFPPEFSSGGAEVEMVSGEEDIKQSIWIILSTSLGERCMLLDFGCELEDFLFEEGGQRLVRDLQEVVYNALLIQEPRIKLDEVKVEDPGTVPGLIHISVGYTVQRTNNRFNLVYPFYFNEAYQ